MSDKLVYSSKLGDLRKQKFKISKDDYEVDKSALKTLIRRLISVKGRTFLKLRACQLTKTGARDFPKDLGKKLV